MLESDCRDLHFAISVLMLSVVFVCVDGAGGRRGWLMLGGGGGGGKGGVKEWNRSPRFLKDAKLLLVARQPSIKRAGGGRRLTQHLQSLATELAQRVGDIFMPEI